MKNQIEKQEPDSQALPGSKFSKASLLAASLATVMGLSSCGGKVIVGDDSIESTCLKTGPDFQGMIEMGALPEAPDDLCESTRTYIQQILCFVDQPWDIKIDNSKESKYGIDGELIYRSNTYGSGFREGTMVCSKTYWAPPSGNPEIKCEYHLGDGEGPGKMGGDITIATSHYGPIGNYTERRGVDLNFGTPDFSRSSFGFYYFGQEKNAPASYSAGNDSKKPLNIRDCPEEYNQVFNTFSNQITSIADRIFEK